MPELRNYIARVEGWWFDRTRHVSTCGAVPLDGLSLAGENKQGFMYLPARSAAVRLALSNLPIDDHRKYTFVDLGSGKGRILFLASEYPFRRIVGVEFAQELHSEAQQNIARYRSRRKRCSEIASIHADASDYEFPRDNLVIALFNPFGAAVMLRVLARIRESVSRSPRDVIMMLLFPELAAVVDPAEWETLQSTRRYCIYRFRDPRVRNSRDSLRTGSSDHQRT
jgi:SAM-dependent methyltransferase